jgi:glycosyltransferase involved in cell wall biosynthesis
MNGSNCASGCDSPEISIIVPVYNTEAYLKNCIESVLMQTYRNFELILVDDGATDASPAICDRYAQSDYRVRTIHKANGGVSSARNLGLENASGKYVVFIDADDYAGTEYLADLRNAAMKYEESNEKVMILSDYQPFSEAGFEQRTYPQPFAIGCDKKDATAEEFRALVFGFIIFPPYCKLYRRDVIEAAHLRFNTALKSAEDFDFNCRYIENMDRICYTPAAEYYYRVGYKSYKPSNDGVLGESEICSVHIMANGITALARRLGVYEEVYEDICQWAARKQYYNRLPMLFAPSKSVCFRERKMLYRQLTADETYHKLYKVGIKRTGRGTTRMIGEKFDCFFCWWVFYRLLQRKRITEETHGVQLRQ